ncbi:hypothetical protein DFQ29_001833 [Apophysomyces sp. BC1021]|nr:hypothetical protein DFQ29_001833 [Apophysomyces sp. BC1021]
MKSYIKRILKTAEDSLRAKQALLDADAAFIQALRDMPSTEMLFKCYLDKSWRTMHEKRERLIFSMQSMLIDPLQKLYQMDIKVAETRRRQFDEQSKNYYTYLSKYLSKSQKKNSDPNQSDDDAKYEIRKHRYDLIRFDYYTFLMDIQGGKKDKEVLYYLLSHEQKQFDFYQSVVADLEHMRPGLDSLAHFMAQASHEQAVINKERSKKRKLLEFRCATDNHITPTISSVSTQETSVSMGDAVTPVPTKHSNDQVMEAVSFGGLRMNMTEGNMVTGKFKGVGDMEEQTPEAFSNCCERRKEGFLLTTSRPSKGGGTYDKTSKTPGVTWHKYWCVLCSGKLYEYRNWKHQLEKHIEPIDLQFATVREARSSGRRFCFEIITPSLRRTYQATSQEEMLNWLTTIGNSIESLLTGMSSSANFFDVDQKPTNTAEKSQARRKSLKTYGRSLGGVLSGLRDGANAAKENYFKRHSNSEEDPADNSKSNGPLAQVCQRACIGDETVSAPDHRSALEEGFSPRPMITDATSLLSLLREEPSNTRCADCGSSNPEWCSLNLGILLCIECSGIHRGFGTHISKIRSLKLDVASFTPDMIELLRSIGNERSNDIWDPRNGSNPPCRPKPNSRRVTKLKYIRSKYVDKAFIEPLQHDANSILFDAIDRDDVAQAAYAIAVGADVNARRSESKGLAPIAIFGWDLSQRCRSFETCDLPYLDKNGEVVDCKTITVKVRQHKPPENLDNYIVSYALHFSLLHGQSKEYSQVFPMAECLIQNGANPGICDPVTGRPLAELVGFGELVHDDALAYLNLKNQTKGLPQISRERRFPPLRLIEK